MAFTLVEALVAAVILAMAVTAIILPFTSALQSQATDAKRTLAVSLAQEMMEEVIAKPFSDSAGVKTPGFEAGENRWNCNCIDDYDGYTEEDGQIRSFDGQVLSDPEAAGLSRHVACAYVYVSGQDTGQPSTFIRVTVEVRYKGQPLVTLSRLVFAH
ncbi:MAG: hypothetical protein ACE15C_05700 [Phycisphaerae bacterium]